MGRLARAGSLLFVLIVDVACGRWPDSGSMTDVERRAAIEMLTSGYDAEFPDVPQMTVSDVVATRESADEVLVDVREPQERAVSRIPGSISREEFEARRSEFADKKVITYCTIGYRSSEYAQKLRRDGFDAVNLRGSILAWVDAGQIVVDQDGRPTKRVHTYGRPWALLPEGYDAVY